MFLPKSKKLHWTFHARAKMAFYKLSEQRVRRVLNSPKRVEEGVAPKTTAFMQPAHVRLVMAGPNGAKRSMAAMPRLEKSNSREETWNQEIWVMVQAAQSRISRGSVRSAGNEIKIISAWRYPGKTKPQSEKVIQGIRAAYNEYMKSAK